MKVKDLFYPYVKNLSLKGVEDREVKGISTNTNEVKYNDILFLFPGNRYDIFYLVRSIKKRPLLVVIDSSYKRILGRINYPHIFLPKVKDIFKNIVDRFYPLPSRLEYIGITGTNGKSSVAYALYSFLNYYGIKSDLIGTVRYFISHKEYTPTHTTPDYLTLRKLICRISSQTKYLVMEVSSHGIAQGRVEGIPFSYCIFTNLSRDHLDYHKSMENYFSVKKSFFYNNPSALYLVNLSDRYGKRLFHDLPFHQTVSYGFRKNCDFFCKDIRLDINRTEFTLLLPSHKEIRFSMKLLGKHNVANMLASLSLLYLISGDLEPIKDYLSGFSNIEGRLEHIGDDIFVDYAHTPQALTLAVKALYDAGYKRVICVFGCGGDRDRGKRKMMGRVAGEYCFHSIITMDNPRMELPMKIVSDIIKGFKHNNYSIVLDRREAIKKAVVKKMKYRGCALLIAGKGHERYQIIGEDKIPFNDKNVVEDILAKYK